MRPLPAASQSVSFSSDVGAYDGKEGTLFLDFEGIGGELENTTIRTVFGKLAAKITGLFCITAPAKVANCGGAPRPPMAIPISRVWTYGVARKL